MRLRVAWLSIFVGLLAVASAFGQARTGTIYGRVTDPEGKPLPGVRVTLFSSVTGQLSVVTDIGGNYRFPSLPPAQDYRLRFELEGFQPIVKENVEVRLGINTQVNAQMAPGAVEEVVVRGEVPVVDVKATEVSINFTRDVLEAIPTGRDPWTVLALAPGIMVDRVDVGGSWIGQQSGVTARGDSRNVQWFYDGVETTEFSYGSANYFDFDAFEEIQIVTGANNVEVLAGGIAINIVTKRGTNRFSGGGRFFWTVGAWQSDNTADVKDQFLSPLSRGNRIDDVFDYGANVSGPFLVDHLWFWAGYGRQDIGRLVPQFEGPDLLDRTVLQEVNLKMNAQFGKHMTELLVFFRDKRRFRRGAGPSRPDETTWDQYSPSPMFKFQDEFFATDELFLSFRAGVQIQNWGLRPRGGLKGPVIFDDKTEVWHNSYWFLDRETPAPHFNVSGIYYLSGWLGGDHEIKFGAEFRRRNFLDEWGPAGGVLWVYNDFSNPALGGEVWFYRARRVPSYWQRFSLYAQDTFTVGRLTLLAGLRYDLQQNGLDETTVEAHPLRPDLFPATTVKPQVVARWHTFSPRFGLTYDLFGDARTILKANVALFPDTLAHEEPRNIATTDQRYVAFEWIGDLNGNGVPDDNELGDFITANFDLANPQKQVNFIADDYTWPKTFEISGGIEQRIAEDIGIALTGFWRRFWDLRFTFPIDPDNPVVNEIYYNCWQEAGQLPPEWGGWPYYYCTERRPPGNLWMNWPDYHRTYWGVELRLTKRMSHGWSAFGSITLQDMTQHYESDRAWVDPTNVAQLNDAPYWTDSSPGGTSTDFLVHTRWMVKAGIAVQLPLDFVASATVTGREGYLFLPYARVRRPSNGWGSRVSVYAVRSGEKRFSPLWLVNLRVEKRLKLGPYGRMYVALDGFNILNVDTVLKWYRRIDSTRFMRVAEIVSPRIFRISLRYEY